MITRATVTVAALAALALSPAMGIGAPSLSDPALSPNSWSLSATTAASWTQVDFSPSLEGPANVQLNTSPDGTSAGTWVTQAVVAGPLSSGSNGVLSMDVSAFEGRHAVRVVIAGVENSPFPLGTLQLDRTPPSISSVLLTPEGGTVVADWIQSDALSGTDPAQPVVVLSLIHI